jgi:tRNA-modifying protein YgfZ
LEQRVSEESMGVSASVSTDLSGHAAAADGGGTGGGFRSGVIRLDELGLLKVHGADAESFLQSQLTNDIASLTDGDVRLAGYCSAKGRLTASFWVWRDTAPDTFWLACSRNLAAAIARRLSMFVLRAKVKVEDASDAITLLGILQVEGDEAAPAAVGAVVLPAVAVSAKLFAALDPARLETATDLRVSRALRPVPAGSLADTLHALQAAGSTQLPMADWRRLEVLSGIARIEAASQELFVPQMINFELVGGVDFKKGCYPGQEVVARSQYLGKLKRRMFLGLGAGEVPAPGSDVHRPAPGSAEPVGQVVLAAPLTDGVRFVVLFESTIQAVAPEGDAQPALQIGASPITRLPLPYPLPAPTAASAARSAPAARVPDAAT